MDAPPCGLPSCVPCDLISKLDTDTDFEAGDSDSHSGPSSDLQGQSADFEPFPDVQGQYYRMGRSHRSIPPTTL